MALFTCNNFRALYTSDVVGVEVGGAVKNVIAIAAVRPRASPLPVPQRAAASLSRAIRAPAHPNRRPIRPAVATGHVRGTRAGDERHGRAGDARLRRDATVGGAPPAHCHSRQAWTSQAHALAAARAFSFERPG
eukprot:3392776-Prymnesium_polylepis.1